MRMEDFRGVHRQIGKYDEQWGFPGRIKVYDHG
jgi:hypothetical protein